MPHTPGGTKVFIGPDHCGSHTARSGQAPHTPGGTEVASFDFGTLRRHHGFLCLVDDMHTWVDRSLVTLLPGDTWVAVGVVCGSHMQRASWFARDVSATPSIWGVCQLRDAPAIPWSV